MEKKYIVNPVNCIVSGLTAVILLSMAINCLADQIYIAVAILSALACIFAVMCINNGAVIGIHCDYVEKKMLIGKPLVFLKSEIQEIGVVGLRMYRKNEHNHGTRYIYFSKSKLTEQDRFELCLSWPPKNMIYMEWTNKRMAAVQNFWSDELAEYNAGDIGL